MLLPPDREYYSTGTAMIYITYHHHHHGHHTIPSSSLHYYYTLTISPPSRVALLRVLCEHARDVLSAVGVCVGDDLSSVQGGPLLRRLGAI